MKEMRLSLAAYVQLIQLRETNKWEWPAVFSTNSREHIWAGKTFGLTPIEDRKELSDMVPALNDIRDVYLVIREQGGRIFINEDGAFWKDEQNGQHRFVEFKFDF